MRVTNNLSPALVAGKTDPRLSNSLPETDKVKEKHYLVKKELAADAALIRPRKEDYLEERHTYSNPKLKHYRAKLEDHLQRPKPEEPPAPSPDINGDGVINEWDLKYVLKHWDSDNLKADINQDGQVDSFDLSYLLGNWGKVGED